MASVSLCHLGELRTVDYFERLPLCELERIISVNAAGHEYPSISALRRHDTEQLADWFYTDFEDLPTFALYDRPLSLAAHPKVIAVIGTATPDILSLESDKKPAS